MKNKSLFSAVFLFVSIGCSAWGQAESGVKNDEALHTVVDNYSRENVDDATIVSLFRKLSDQGDARATLWLARLHWGGRCGLEEAPGVADDLAAPVIDQVVKLAEGGDHEAQFLIGVCYDEGFCLEFDGRKAVAWYLKAIEGRQLSTYGNLALHFAEGTGVEADIGRARALLKTGAEQGSLFCRNLLPHYAPPNSQSLVRLRELRQNKVMPALGLKTAEAVRVLVDAGVITHPENDIDFLIGRSLYHDFEDDGIVMNTGGDGIVRCVDAYRGMTTSNESRGGIPFGIAWSDDGNKIKAKLGNPYQEYGLSGDGSRQYVYQAGNMMFSLVVDAPDNPGVKFWRVREMWSEDFADAK